MRNASIGEKKLASLASNFFNRSHRMHIRPKEKHQTYLPPPNIKNQKSGGKPQKKKTHTKAIFLPTIPEGKQTPPQGNFVMV